LGFVCVCVCVCVWGVIICPIISDSSYCEIVVILDIFVCL